MTSDKKFVYADNAATTPVRPEVADEIDRAIREMWGNPSALYDHGQRAKAAVEDARARIAKTLNCLPEEIFFTSCGSESDNWAIKGTALAKQKRGKHIITSSYEHHAVVNAMRSLAREGFEITNILPDADGIVSPEKIEAAIRDDTVLICVMYANNEIGSINPIEEIAKIASERKITFFCDGVQAIGHIPVDLHRSGVDTMSFSGHKFGAPKGVGGLYIRKGTVVRTLVDGGGQERGRRGGTENVPYIVGTAKALELSAAEFVSNGKVAALRDRLAEGLLKIPYSRINGGMDHRLPGNLNMSFDFVEGESLLLLCDAAGICLSTGSACSSNSLEPSHVLLSIGVPAEKAHGSLRFSLSHNNTEEDVDYILEKLPEIVARLRAMSPLYDERSM